MSGTVSLWIECPDCAGGGGWHGCLRCGDPIGEHPNDEGLRPKVDHCADCLPILACEEDGGHDWEPFALVPAGDWERRQHDYIARYERSCRKCPAHQAESRRV